MVSVVVFDLDDTLYLEADFVRSGFHSVGEWCRKVLKVEGFETTAWRLFRDGRRGDIFDAALSKLGVAADKSAIARMVAVYRMHPPQIALPPDSVQCLAGLRGKYRLGLITDGPAEMQWNKIRALGLDKICDETIVTADLGEGFSKPHARAFLEMEERFQVSGAELCYVADNPAKDFIAPRQRGWRTIRIVRGKGLHRKATGGPNVSMEDLEGLSRVLAAS
jgi:putative hydrolase of the HAD superfamily